MSSLSRVFQTLCNYFLCSTTVLYIVFGFCQHISHLSAETFTIANKTCFADIEEIQLVLKTIIGFPDNCILYKIYSTFIETIQLGPETILFLYIIIKFSLAAILLVPNTINIFQYILHLQVFIFKIFLEDLLFAIATTQ
jgi:hypothetical protein